jgi:PmbA protein
LSVRDEKVDKFSQAESLGYSIRVIKDGKLGFSFLIGGNKEELSQAVDQALTSARDSDLEFSGTLPQSGANYAQTEVFDSGSLGESLAEKQKRAVTLARAAKEADPRISHVYPAGIEEYTSFLDLLNSRGLALSHKSTYFAIGAEALAEENGEQEVGFEGRGARFLADLDPVETGRAAGLRAVANLGGKPISDGRYDVILENQVVAQFLGILSASMSGESVFKGRSLLADKKEKLIFDPAVNILDDGLFPKGPGTRPFDAEGTPIKRTKLVEKGIVKNFIYDCLWAHFQGIDSTGNAVRGSLKAPPSVGFNNLILEPGRKTRADLTKGLEKGIFITEILGGHTADPISGDFSFGAAGRLIENGVLTSPVKSIAIAGNILDVFGSMKEIANDFRFFGTTGCASALVTEMSVSGP